MYLEEHRPAASGNTRPMAELDRGAFAENYGHAGTDAKILGYVMPDWGGGTAVSAAALAELTWGDLYVDAARGAAFGVNGCRVLRSDIRPDSISLEVERLPGSSLLLKCPQAAAPRVELTVDGQKRGAFDPPALARGVRV
jgi:hypothetical protein